MKKKSRSIKYITKTKKGKRQYADPDATLFTHPTRAKIIDLLKDGKKTTGELESLIGENRINLYHHLNLLESEAIVTSTIANRQKIFEISKDNIPDPQIIIIKIPNLKNIQEEVMNSFSKIFSLVNDPQTVPKSLSGKKIILEFQ